MARRVFFSFHYERDIWRASQIRNSWVTKLDREDAGFWNAASWEEVKKKGDEAIKRWIDAQMEGTSVTAVLIGAETSERKYVGYEIEQSHNRRNGMLAIYIHNVQDQYRRTDLPGKNPLAEWHIIRNGSKILLSNVYRAYDWVANNGYVNLGTWIEQAAKDAAR